MNVQNFYNFKKNKKEKICDASIASKEIKRNSGFCNLLEPVWGTISGLCPGRESPWAGVQDRRSVLLLKVKEAGTLSQAPSPTKEDLNLGSPWHC